MQASAADCVDVDSELEEIVELESDHDDVAEISDESESEMMDRDSKKWSILRRIPTDSAISDTMWGALKYLQIACKRRLYHFLMPKTYLMSRGLSVLDIEELFVIAPFSKTQFCVLIDEFLRLCGVDVYDEAQNERHIASISMDRMMHTIYLRYNPWRERIRTLFEQDLREQYDEDHRKEEKENGDEHAYQAAQSETDVDIEVEDVASARRRFQRQVTFFDFCKCLSIFAEQTPRASKIRFAYRIYDMEDDGFISRRNLFDVLHAVLGSLFDEQQITAIVNATFKHCQLNKDGNIDYQEFRSVVAQTDIGGNFTIHF